MDPDLRFTDRILRTKGAPLVSGKVHTFQVNVGYLCNQECGHCHHKAGPKREEVMAWSTMQVVIDKAKETGIGTVDITGGAPELNPSVRSFVRELRRNGRRILFRTNLTAFQEEGLRDIPRFLRENQVEVIASLPCYFRDETDQQRGDGVFIRSIKGLKALNTEGFGTDGGPPLHLVYNPYEAFLPPAQSDLEKDYRRILMDSYGIEFTDLYTITNMPMGRFWEDLKAQGTDEVYMKLLTDNFNPSTLGSLMCLGQVSIGWDGRLYDCDFNQATGMDTCVGKARTIFELEGDTLAQRTIRTADHCYGCTAGAGSSCGGALVN